MKFSVTMFLTLAIFLTGLPVSIDAQTTGYDRPGTSAYYSDNTVYRRKVVRQVRIKRLGWLHIGGDPQFPGGLYNTPPAADEYDEPLDREIEGVTISRSWIAYAGVIPPVLENGQVVMVRRKKVTRKIIAIINCGNWTRQLGAEAEITEVKGETEFLPCKPFPEGRRLVRDEVIGNVRYEEWFDGCQREIVKTVTNTKSECVPGSWLVVVQSGPDRRKLSGKSFRAADMIPGAIQEQVFAQDGALREKKVKFLQVLQGACESEKNKIRIVWFSDGWHWKEFFIGALVGFGAGFLVGYLVKGTPDCPVLIPPKDKDQIRPNPIPPLGGSGTIGTRPVRPRP